MCNMGYLSRGFHVAFVCPSLTRGKRKWVFKHLLTVPRQPREYHDRRQIGIRRVIRNMPLRECPIHTDLSPVSAHSILDSASEHT